MPIITQSIIPATDTETIRQQFYCDVYLIALQKKHATSSSADEMASDALADFDEQFPTEEEE